MPNLKDQLIFSIIEETVSSIPEEMYEFFSELPGRSPSEISKYNSNSMNKLDRDQAISLFRAAVDSAIFSILYLMENEFKENLIETSFLGRTKEVLAASDGLTDLYRAKVDPGGILVD